jgi:hypothetical protein
MSTPVALPPVLHAAVVLPADATAPILVKHMNLPLDWLASFHRVKIEQIVLDGMREMQHGEMGMNEPCSFSLKADLPNAIAYAWRSEERAAFVIVSNNYPKRAALILLKRMLNEKIPELARVDFLKENSDPDRAVVAGPIAKVQTQLMETKLVLIDTITKVLDRGEKLEVLEARTRDLSAAAVKFGVKAKKLNSCCPSW